MESVLKQIEKAQRDFLENAGEHDILVIELTPRQIAIMIDEIGWQSASYNAFKCLLKKDIREVSFDAARIRMKGEPVETIVTL